MDGVHALHMLSFSFSVLVVVVLLWRDTCGDSRDEEMKMKGGNVETVE
jgi:hypothetical protein